MCFKQEHRGQLHPGHTPILRMCQAHCWEAEGREGLLRWSVYSRRGVRILLAFASEVSVLFFFFLKIYLLPLFTGIFFAKKMVKG